MLGQACSSPLSGSEVELFRATVSGSRIMSWQLTLSNCQLQRKRSHSCISKRAMMERKSKIYGCKRANRNCIVHHSATAYHPASCDRYHFQPAYPPHILRRRSMVATSWAQVHSRLSGLRHSLAGSRQHRGSQQASQDACTQRGTQ